MLTFAFASMLLVGVMLKFWLGWRHMRHITWHRAQVPALFTPMIPLPAHQKAADYTIAKVRFGLMELTMGSVVLIGWTLLGGLTILNQFVLSWLEGGMIQQLALLAAYVLINGLIDLPMTLYQTFVIEQRFGFNKITLRLWLMDLLKSTLMGIVFGLLIGALILWLMGTAGGWWWLWAWGVWMSFNLLMLFVYPAFIAPLFNKFVPLEDETLKSSVTALMERCGFAAKGLFVMDGSKRSAHANAYFTGFGAAKRVVFYDTLLSKLSATEVNAVLAHELGHFKHKHIVKRIGSMFIISLLCFALLGWLATQIWFYTGLGVEPNLVAPNDALALALFMLAIPVFSFPFTPLFAYFSREHEFEADAYAVAHTNGQDLATALLKLYEDNASTLTADPIYVKYYYSHPPASERLARIVA